MSRYKSTAIILLIVGLILLIPFVAMQQTNEVNWTLSDFVVAGFLLTVTGIALDIISRKSSKISYRLASAIAIGTALLIVWSNLAVGIIGSEDNSANLMYLGVLTIGVFGGLIVKFRPLGMSFALIATAIAQVIVTAIAVFLDLGAPYNSSTQLIIFNGFFIELWLVSAWFFAKVSMPETIMKN
jgi:predicted membrane channel-forming protein YqfA (hemolysin III family)